MIDDELVNKAIEIAKNNKDNFSMSLLQRKLRIGVINANKLLEILENKKVISEYKDGHRKILI